MPVRVLHKLALGVEEPGKGFFVCDGCSGGGAVGRPDFCVRWPACLCENDLLRPVGLLEEKVCGVLHRRPSKRGIRRVEIEER